MGPCSGVGTNSHRAGQDDRAAQTNRKNNKTAGQKESNVTKWQKPEDVWQEEAGNQQWLQEVEWWRRKDYFLPCRRFGGDISSPNLVEGTCREASRTYHGNSCGHFPGGEKMVGAHGRGDEDFPGEVELGFKGGEGEGGGVTSSHKTGKTQERGWGGKREENTEILVNKISRISWSGMPLELDLRFQEWIPEQDRRGRCSGGFPVRRCCMNGGILVENESVFYKLKNHTPENLSFGVLLCNQPEAQKADH